MEQRKREVLDAMGHIMDPDLGQDIVSLGFIKDIQISGDGDVAFTVELTTPACPVKETFKRQCEEAVQRLAWVKSVAVTMSAQKRQPKAPSDQPSGVAKVANIIAVSSAKGGVGKSTVAVNLAYALVDAGAQVGLLDADIFGPSLPTLVRPIDTTLRYAGELLKPVEHFGLKLMSFGWATGANQAAIMRGPMVSSVVNQLATGTNWGELDYLVVDLPPGTGDIQLTLTQRLDFAGALIVTTPQQLSFADVVRGIEMFSTVKVPTLGLIENMSYYVCPSCGDKSYPFGKGASDRIRQQYGIEQNFEIPMHADLSAQSDAGQPIVIAQPDSDLTAIYRDIASQTVREVARSNHGAGIPEVTFTPLKGVVMTWPDGREKIINPAALRRACRCAACVDEHTGEQILKPETVPDDVVPTAIEKRGNYAVAVTWSDGHDSSIYPFTNMEAL